MSLLPTFRFAPSPNGQLHLGHAYSALLNFRLAEKMGGRFLLRIEDVDGGRARPEFEQAIYDDLAWLGIKWETSVRRQSEHLGDYTKALETLQTKGVIYPCFASRSEIEAATARSTARNPDGTPLYPGIYRDLALEQAETRIAAGEPHALRLNMQKALRIATARTSNITFTVWHPDGTTENVETDPAVWGDIVLARKEIKTSYTLAVVIDDALQGVSHVVRGMDLYHATSVQRLLQILLDLPVPVYHHHPLVLDPAGRKLAKSRQDASLCALRMAGLPPEQVYLQLPPFALN